MYHPLWIRATKMLFVFCLCLLSRIWLYFQYFTTVREMSGSECAIVTVAMVLMLGFIRAIYKSTVNGTLMTRGLYRFVAHPTYSVYILGDIPLWYIMPLTAYSLISGILFYAVLFRTAYLEEVYMLNKFGKEAQKYYRRTPSVHLLLWRLRRQS